VLRESARKEFEASRFEKDPETVSDTNCFYIFLPLYFMITN